MLESVPFPRQFDKLLFSTIFKGDFCISFHKNTGWIQTAVTIVGIHFISQLK